MILSPVVKVKRLMAQGNGTYTRFKYHSLQSVGTAITNYISTQILARKVDLPESHLL